MEKVMILSTAPEIAEGLMLFMEKYKKPDSESSFETEKINRRDAAKFLSVSYQTMYNWTKSGIIKEHGRGRKKFYLRQELIDALKSNR
jgi:hypothetical protein